MEIDPCEGNSLRLRSASLVHSGLHLRASSLRKQSVMLGQGCFRALFPEGLRHTNSLRLLNALNSEDRGLKVRFSLAMIVFETFELILCQMLSSQGKNAPSNPYPHYLVRLAASRN